MEYLPITTKVSKLKYIPVDYIKVIIIGLSKDWFFQNKKLSFTPFLIGDEVKYSHVTHNGMKLKVYENGTILLSGSLHKYYNDGKHNHNDFHVMAFDKALKSLESHFGINPKNILLKQLEFGVNIKPPIPTSSIISNLYLHKRVEFELPINSSRGKFLQFKHDKYILKIYNKSLQYNLQCEIMRIEIKQSWSEYRNKNGVLTLQDFIEMDKQPLHDKLVDEWNYIVFFDPTNNLPKKWLKYNNHNYWNYLNCNVSRNSFCKHVNRLKSINAENGQNIQSKIGKLISENIHDLQKGYEFQL